MSTDTAEPPRTPNVELLKRTLAHIETDPEHWSQDVWAEKVPECGTKHCFGGWAVTLGKPDAEFAWVDKLVAIYGPDGKPVDGEGADHVHLPDGRVCTVRTAAAELLGLTHEQVSDLFYSVRSDTLEGLRGIVAEITASARP